MTIRGKHAKCDTGPAPYGKHAGADVSVRFDSVHLTISAVLLAVLIFVPFSLNRAINAADSRAFADASQALTTSVVESAVAVVEPDVAEAFAVDPAVSSVSVGTDDPSALPSVGYTRRVGEKYQTGLMEGGCELVSLSIVLDAMGLNTDIHKLVDDHLTVNGHFASAYAGDPYERGGGFPAGIVDATNSYLIESGSSVHAQDLTGKGFDDLMAYVDKGYPVLLWCTMGFESPRFTGIFDDGKEWYDNEHCVVLYGRGDDGTVLLSDPLQGLVSQDANGLAELYTACGRMAMAIV